MSEPSELDQPGGQATAGSPPTTAERIVALLEVIVCSEYPTQLALGGLLFAFGVRAFTPDGNLNLKYVAAVSMLDTLLLISLILVFLRAHNERPRDVFLGERPISTEIARGLWLSIVALLIAVAVLALILQFAPRLHTVATNPLQALMQNPRDAVIFALVVVIAGGVREELQRAFLLRRFERWLGGSTVGIVVTSVVFGSGHFTQGVDAMIATAVLGAFWGVVYLRRRSAVSPIVSHACFNLLQLLQFLVLGR